MDCLYNQNLMFLKGYCAKAIMRQDCKCNWQSPIFHIGRKTFWVIALPISSFYHLMLMVAPFMKLCNINSTYNFLMVAPPSYKVISFWIYQYKLKLCSVIIYYNTLQKRYWSASVFERHLLTKELLKLTYIYFLHG